MKFFAKPIDFCMVSNKVLAVKFAVLHNLSHLCDGVDVQQRIRGLDSLLSRVKSQLAVTRKAENQDLFCFLRIA